MADAEAGPAATESTKTAFAASVENKAVAVEKSLDADTNPNIVNWEGPDDPKNPRNWSQGFKLLNVLLIGLAILCTNFATTMFAPAAPQLADEFNVHSSILATLSVTIPSLGAATGPLLFAPLSEIFGRVRIYIVTSLLFLALAVGLARSTGIAMFLVFRFLDGVCYTSYLTCGAGTIADLFEHDNRGAASAVFALAPLLGPVLGPVIGGFVAQELDWRWIFYIILMVTGAVTAAVIIFMRESMETILLERIAQSLRKSTGNLNLRSAVSRDLPVSTIVACAFSRPIRMLLFSPIVLLLGLYLAFVFGLTFLLLATLSELFVNNYGFKQGVAGLAFLGLGIGCVIGTILFAKFSDKMAKKNSTPEHRLIMMMLGGPFVPASLFWYGWSAEYHVHWIVPIIGTGFIGIGIVFVTASGQLYMIDTFGSEGSASAMAALTLVRNGSGAFLLELGANPELRDEYGPDRPLTLACWKGHLEVAKVLLDHGASTKDAMATAAENGHLDIVKELMRRGVDTKGTLARAAKGGYMTIVRLLLDHGVDANEDSPKELLSALKLEHQAMFDFLMERGATLFAHRETDPWSKEGSVDRRGSTHKRLASY